MPIYIRNRKEFDAWQWRPEESGTPNPNWVEKAKKLGVDQEGGLDFRYQDGVGHTGTLQTEDGPVTLSPFDWLVAREVKDPQDEYDLYEVFATYSPDEFKVLYKLKEE